MQQAGSYPSQAPAAAPAPGAQQTAEYQTTTTHPAPAPAPAVTPARAAGHPRIAVHAALVGSQHIGCAVHARAHRRRARR